MSNLLLTIVFICCVSSCTKRYSPDIDLPEGPVAKTYYVNNITGNDSNDGLSPHKALKSLEKAGTIVLKPGEKLLLSGKCTFTGHLDIKGYGSKYSPVTISSYESSDRKPVINSKGYVAGIEINNGSNIIVSDIEIISDGGQPVESDALKKRHGVWIVADQAGNYSNIQLQNLFIHNIFATEGQAGSGQNPLSNFGHGIVIFSAKDVKLKNILIENCRIETTGHTGIKLNGTVTSKIDSVKILYNNLKHIGGPGMVPSNCQNVFVAGNTVDCSGYTGDSRMHGRGSGIWPWSSNNVLIENNRFMHAHGRHDSHGVHIDFNCSDVVVQYNLLVDNEGGFVEILGNTNNCAYRYNISINEGARVKGQNNGNAAGLILWTSGYVGENKRTGPFNSYIYNNTIFVKEDILSGFSFDTTSRGILIANNIFYLLGETGVFRTGPEAYEDKIPNLVFKNNLYNKADLMPADLRIKDTFPLSGNPSFTNPGGLKPEDYIPLNADVVRDKGIIIERIPFDDTGLKRGLSVDKDFFGNPVTGNPDLGAVELQ